tara:strand:- start:49 stop:618 length:570 start_codon:yes stop_codon:yes gene_type:complete
MLRKYVLEASLLDVLQSTTPIVLDAEMTAGGLHRFHAIVQVNKSTPQHNGLQRNVILAAFGALKDLDLVTVVDDDIDIRDPLDVEYAIATRFEASKDLITIPDKQFVVINRVIGDGKTGTFLGYSVYSFKNADSISVQFSGGWGADGVRGDYKIITGTGAYANAKGDGSFVRIGGSKTTSHLDVTLNVQ